MEGNKSLEKCPGETAELVYRPLYLKHGRNFTDNLSSFLSKRKKGFKEEVIYFQNKILRCYWCWLLLWIAPKVCAASTRDIQLSACSSMLIGHRSRASSVGSGVAVGSGVSVGDGRERKKPAPSDIARNIIAPGTLKSSSNSATNVVLPLIIRSKTATIVTTKTPISIAKGTAFLQRVTWRPRRASLDSTNDQRSILTASKPTRALPISS